ncbi:LRC71 protein, partial [Acromyrmex heyeri]
MSNGKSNHAASIKDRESSINNYSRRSSQENFITEFLTHCEEYDIESLPSFVIRDDTEQYTKIEPEKVKMDEDILNFYVSFENPKKMETMRKLVFHVARQEVSICILDALNTTLQKYNTITVLKLPSCQINAYGILLIAHMLTELEYLNDLNLDDNPNPQENYYLLCALAQKNLHYLSLRMCKLSDNGIQKIANELKYQDPPNEPKLIALNVADNDITDIGAEYIAEMLRTNRSLQSVVLTGNKIQDDGALLIIQELVMSTLTHEEIVGLRRRRFIELESKMGIPFNSLPSSSIQILKKLSSNDIGYPFTTETIAIDNCVITSGNLNLQHLSLNFNRLTNKTLKKLVSCLHYQSYMLLGDNTRGLLHVFLEGNDIEKDDDWIMLEELLRRRRQKDQTLQAITFKNLKDSITSIESLRRKISVWLYNNFS